MPPEDIDDLFRDQLDGHATPPGDALWARLQAQARPETTADAHTERLDLLFQKGLNTHSTRPSRELWERLEDEHLRPRKRRATAWWPTALAAALALLLVAGGAGLWLGIPLRQAQTGSVATKQGLNNHQTAGHQPNKASTTSDTAPAQALMAAANSTNSPQPAHFQRTAKKNTAQATRPAALASTAPKARMPTSGQSLRRMKETNRQPDAATASLPLLARTTARTASQRTQPRPTHADEQRTITETEQAVATNTQNAFPVEIVPANSVPTSSVASAGALITVDVRSGGEPTARPNKFPGLAAAATEAPSERRRLGGRLLQQASNLVRGERVSLAEVTGLPETLTVRATVAGHSLTKSIQL